MANDFEPIVKHMMKADRVCVQHSGDTYYITDGYCACSMLEGVYRGNMTVLSGLFREVEDGQGLDIHPKTATSDITTDPMKIDRFFEATGEDMPIRETSIRASKKVFAKKKPVEYSLFLGDGYCTTINRAYLDVFKNFRAADMVSAGPLSPIRTVDGWPCNWLILPVRPIDSINEDVRDICAAMEARA